MKFSRTKSILLSVLLAIIFGVCTPTIFPLIYFLGDIFINLLKLFALPLICSALIVALGNINHTTGQLKTLAKNTISYMLISEFIAVSIALFLFNTFKPGVNVNPNIILHGAPYVANEHIAFNFSTFLISIFPHNIFESLSKFELLPVVIFSIMFGVGCATLGNKAKPIVNLFESIRDVANLCLQGVMFVAPIGIFVLVGSGIAQSHQSGNLSSDFSALLNFVLVLCLGLSIHALWQLILVVITTKQSPMLVLKKSGIVFATAFATSSSTATLPVAMNTAIELKGEESATRFMLPLCASINIGGMMMYEVAAALFFSQVLGVNLTMPNQILLAIACILGGMAEGGIPETSLVSLVIVFKIVNVPLSAISILLPLDRIIDRLRTMVNIFGNMCGAIIISHLTASKKVNINE